MDDDLADWYPAASAARLRAHEPTEDDCAKCNEEFSANQLEDVDGKMLCPECSRECWVCGVDAGEVVARAWVTTLGSPETAHCRDLCAACLTECRENGRVVKVESYVDTAIREMQAAIDDDERTKISAFDSEHARGRGMVEDFTPEADTNRQPSQIGDLGPESMPLYPRAHGAAQRQYR